MSSQNFACGTVEGTGSAINVSTGFQPDYVKVLNYDSATIEGAEWFGGAGMPDGSAIKQTGTPTRTKITSNGISAYAGDDTNEEGFTIGADADINASGETIYWIAMRV